MSRKKTLKKSRQHRAKLAQEYLQKILEEPQKNSEDFLKTASKQLWNISTRHRIGLPETFKNRFCRKCKNLLYPGLNSRVRIRSKVRYLTCNECGMTKRTNFRS
jgi:ribonuclease P protein subunit RPR2